MPSVWRWPRERMVSSHVPRPRTTISGQSRRSAPSPPSMSVNAASRRRGACRSIRPPAAPLVAALAEESLDLADQVVAGRQARLVDERLEPLDIGPGGFL